MKSFIAKAHFAAFIVFCAASTFLSAQTNQYLQYDGVNDYTEFPAAAQYLTGLNTVSMTGWFKTDALTYGQGMMSIRGGGTGQGEMYLIQLNNGTIECRVITNTGLHQVVAPAGTVVAGEWQHYAWVFNQNTIQLYVDGVLIGSSSASGTFQSANRPFTVGITLQSGFNFVFKGGADEVSLWAKALMQSEVQAMMVNELSGDETDLVTYYKFNQGTPGGNNLGISQLISEVGMGDRNSNFVNFALTGTASNFVGELASGFQAISFPPIGNKLITDVPFALSAEANSGLPIAFEILSGPASLSGNTLTLDGVEGEVLVKASQEGNAIFDPASDIFVSFNVLDPATTLPEIALLHPLVGDVYLPLLRPIQIAVKSTIPYPDLFEVGAVTVSIGGEEVVLDSWNNGFYTGWYTPQSFGQLDIAVNASNNFGSSANLTGSLNLTSNFTDITANATDEAWVNVNVSSVTVEADLPSYVGAFDEIIGNLSITCPPGGCDPWDRVSSVEVQGKNGEWYEIIRYLTPYGVACNHEIDLTDFMSLLSGRTAFRVNLVTFANGFEYTLDLDYQAGEPEQPYSQIQKLWYETYPFGDFANLQPAGDRTVTIPENTSTAVLKLVSTGHGWGVDENSDTENTNNAAEFSNNTHHIWVNGAQTFSQNNWNDCNPNPDSCSPQAGTWQFDRAGWCPGSIAQFFDYDLSAYVAADEMNLNYIFDANYVDLCHPNHPNCVSGVTCDNCGGGFNPHLIVSSYFISKGNSPLGVALGLTDRGDRQTDFSIFPNPAIQRFFVGLNAPTSKVDIVVYDRTGRSVAKINQGYPGDQIEVNLAHLSTGVYYVQVSTDGGVGTKAVFLGNR